MYPLETGGTIVGWRNAGHWVIKGICGPGPNATHKPTRFKPDHQYRLDFIRERFHKTRGAEVYLGDWHTHPNQTVPNISWLDRWELGRIACHTATNDIEPIMGILGIDEMDQHLRLWSGRPVFPRQRFPLVKTTVLPKKIYQ